MKFLAPLCNELLSSRFTGASRSSTFSAVIAIDENEINKVKSIIFLMA
jgi:hypothetical protein